MKATVQISRGIESLFGTRDQNIRLIESGLGVSTHLLDNLLEIEGGTQRLARGTTFSTNTSPWSAKAMSSTTAT